MPQISKKKPSGGTSNSKQPAPDTKTTFTALDYEWLSRGTTLGHARWQLRAQLQDRLCRQWHEQSQYSMGLTATVSDWVKPLSTRAYHNRPGRGSPRSRQTAGPESSASSSSRMVNDRTSDQMSERRTDYTGIVPDSVHMDTQGNVKWAWVFEGTRHDETFTMPLCTGMTYPMTLDTSATSKNAGRDETVEDVAMLSFSSNSTLSNNPLLDQTIDPVMMSYNNDNSLLEYPFLLDSNDYQGDAPVGLMDCDVFQDQMPYQPVEMGGFNWDYAGEGLEMNMLF